MYLSQNSNSVERWGTFEVVLKGPQGGNPYIDVQVSAQFKCDTNEHGSSEHVVSGFYDGNGVYCIRFMPEQTGNWTYTTISNISELNAQQGSFECVEASSDNHGPVKVHNTYHFKYADGTPYYPFGTTCYAWTHQGDELEEQTLSSLKNSPFNKVRMCVFPKRYSFNENEPQFYPFPGNLEEGWDFTKFNPEYFRHFEKRVQDLMNLGIEADIILFHPYDKGHWGFDRMDSEVDDRYLRYIIARLSAYRNVWWSLANEFDFMREKKMADWDRYLDIIVESDPYKHLCSIHNGSILYPHWKPGITHVSIQNGSAVGDFGRAGLMREVYNKPIIYDEVCYEGDIERRWGNISAEEMVHRTWQGVIAGTYVTHGETFIDPQDILWWAKGGVLHGQSPARIAFLRKIVEESPEGGLNPIDKWQNLNLAGKPGGYFLHYFGKEQPQEWEFKLPKKAALEDGAKLRAEVIDTWDMTITPVNEVFEVEPVGMYFFIDRFRRSIKLPGKPYMALRIKVVNEK